MLELLTLILPIYLLIALGFISARTGFLPANFVPAAGSLVINIALPALIIDALLRQNLQETFNANYLLSYGLGSLVAFGAGLAAFSLLMKRPITEAAIAAFGSSTSNSGFVGLPVVTMVLGATALKAVPLTMLIENLLIIPLALTLAEMGSHSGKRTSIILRETLQRLISSPLLISIVLGAALSAFQTPLPAPFLKSLNMLAGASVPCALLIIGATLATMKSNDFNPGVVWISIFKLGLHPAAVGLFFILFGGVSPDMVAAGIILASAPMVTIFPIIGARYNLQSLSAAALLVATTASFVTITLVLAIVMA